MRRQWRSCRQAASRICSNSRSGSPLGRYVLWRKLTRAMLAIGKERTIAAAAAASDFADAAHLTRTFYQMFGIPPSVMMRGDFFEISSPFSSAQ